MIQLFTIFINHLLSQYRKMGPCAIERQLISGHNRSQHNRTGLSFKSKLWPKNNQINFRDQSTCITQKLGFALEQSQTISFSLFSLLSLAHSLPKGLNNVQCYATKRTRGYEVCFSGQSVWRSAVNWLEIKQHDVCIIGKTRYRLSQFIHYNDRCSQLEETLQAQDLPSTSQEEQRRCRVCYLSTSAPENPLVSPCQCRGSIENIHMQCLRDWLFGNINFGQTINLQAKKAICQICKTNMSESETYNRIIANMLAGRHDIQAPFIILEGSLHRGADVPKTKSYIVLSFASKKEFKIGRSQNADICDRADPFISRINSLIKYEGGKVFIKDNESKHGTAIVLSDTVLLGQDQEEHLIFNNANIVIKHQPS